MKYVCAVHRAFGQQPHTLGHTICKSYFYLTLTRFVSFFCFYRKYFFSLQNKKKKLIYNSPPAKLYLYIIMSVGGVKIFQFSATAAPLFEQNKNIYNLRRKRTENHIFVLRKLKHNNVGCSSMHTETDCHTLSDSLSLSLSNAGTLCVGRVSLSKTINRFLSNEMFSQY